MNVANPAAEFAPAHDRARLLKARPRSDVGNTILAAFFLFGIIFVNATLAQGDGRMRVMAWIVTLLGMASILACVGDSINKRPAGIIIDNRNRISLSKFQATAWTVLILSGLITAVATRMHRGEADALDIKIPTELFAMMGISVVSLVATPALLSLKTHAEPEPEEIRSALAVGSVDNEGKVHGRPDARGAMWSDIFRGDEVSNADSPDLGKVQQAFVTALLLIFYGVAIGDALRADAIIAGMPNPGEQMAWLLGISHAGYLGYKAAPHSRTAAAPAPVEEVG